MPIRNRVLREFTLNYAANQTVSEDINRGGIISALVCRLTGQLDNNTNSTAPMDIAAGDGLAVIRRMRVLINSTEVVRDLDARGILLENYYMLGRFVRDRLGQLGDSSTADPSFDLTFVVPFALPRRKVQVPLSTALDTRAGRVSNVELEITWGNHTSIDSGSQGFVTAPKLEVHALHGFEIPEGFAPGYLRGYQIRHVFSASNPQEEIKLPTSHTYYGMALNAIDDGADSEAILNKVTLQTGSFIYERWDPVSLHEGYGRLWMGRDPKVDETLLSSAYNPGAYYPLERPYDGDLSQLLVAAGLTQLELELDVTHVGGTNTVVVQPYQFIPSPARAA